MKTSQSFKNLIGPRTCNKDTLDTWTTLRGTEGHTALLRTEYPVSASSALPYAARSD